MSRIHEQFQLRPQSFHLRVGQNANALQVTVFAEEFELLLAQAIAIPVASSS